MATEDPKAASAEGTSHRDRAVVDSAADSLPEPAPEPPISAPELDWTEEDDAIADAVAEEMEARRRRAMGLP